MQLYGELSRQDLHSENGGASFATYQDFFYNERGWLELQGSPLFSQELRYQLPTAGATAQYNGSISEQHWAHGSLSTSPYFTYSYDKLDRMLSGVSIGGGMSEQLEYDRVGNIGQLIRDGHTTAYSYTQGRLQEVWGTISGVYSYDASGNALTDRTGFTYTYNHLNLPSTASKTGVSISYSYDALGNKKKA